MNERLEDMASYQTGIPDFSDHTKRLHRNLVAACSIFLAVEWLGIPVDSAKVFDVPFGQLGGNAFQILMLVIILYNFVIYVLNARSDVANSQWSQTYNYSLQFKGPMERIANGLQGLPPIKEQEDSRWKEMNQSIVTIMTKLEPFPDRLGFFASIIKWRLRVECWFAIVLTTLTIITFLFNASNIYHDLLSSLT